MVVSWESNCQGRLVFSHEQYAMFFYYVLSPVGSWRQRDHFLHWCLTDGNSDEVFLLAQNKKMMVAGCRLQEQVQVWFPVSLSMRGQATEEWIHTSPTHFRTSLIFQPAVAYKNPRCCMLLLVFTTSHWIAVKIPFKKKDLENPSWRVKCSCSNRRSDFYGFLTVFDLQKVQISPQWVRHGSSLRSLVRFG